MGLVGRGVLGRGHQDPVVELHDAGRGAAAVVGVAGVRGLAGQLVRGQELLREPGQVRVQAHAHPGAGGQHPRAEPVREMVRDPLPLRLLRSLALGHGSSPCAGRAGCPVSSGHRWRGAPRQGSARPGRAARARQRSRWASSQAMRFRGQGLPLAGGPGRKAAGPPAPPAAGNASSSRPRPARWPPGPGCKGALPGMRSRGHGCPIAPVRGHHSTPPLPRRGCRCRSGTSPFAGKSRCGSLARRSRPGRATGRAQFGAHLAARTF